MKRFLLRTHAGKAQGIGHLVRCITLVKTLFEKGHSCRLLVDQLDESWSHFCEGVEIDNLYGEGRGYTDELTDALSVSTYCQSWQPDWLIVDDYRLGAAWEAKVGESGIRVMAIDDLCRNHQCDLLLDFKWRGSNTAASYHGLVAEKTQTLLGPEYVLLDEVYQQHNSQRRQFNTLESLAPFRVVIGMGGSGDLSLSRRIIQALDSVDIPHLHIVPIVGPSSEGKDDFLAYCQTRENTHPVVGASQLYPHIKSAHLYIGAAGGVLYQLLALGVPVLTFALESNQVTPIKELEGIGHFFHLDTFSELELTLLAKFVNTCHSNFSRIQALTKAGECMIDGYGASRVADVLCGESVHKTPSNRECNGSFESLAGGYRLRPVTDKDVNAYLDARNLAANQKNMINSQLIHRLAHYSWWFNSKRESFLLSHQEQERLYIWHEQRFIHDRQILMGGWFVCGDETGYQDALLALKWQLSYCDNHFPGVPWLAVIHKENRYVKLMNQYLGFIDIEEGHPLCSLVQEIFPEADKEVFHFVARLAPEIGASAADSKETE